MGSEGEGRKREAGNKKKIKGRGYCTRMITGKEKRAKVPMVPMLKWQMVTRMCESDMRCD